MFSCPRFCAIFFGDDVTRFPCGYIYIYIILYNACRQHGFMLNGSNTIRVCPLCDSALTTLVQDHLHNCVVAFQAVLLVHLTQDGRILGRHHAGGNQSRNDRCLQAHVSPPGQGSSEDPPTTKRRRTRKQKDEAWQGQRQEQRQEQGQGSQDQPAPGRVREPELSASAHGPPDSQARSAIEVHARRQFLRMFSGPTSSINAPRNDCRDHAVETGLREQEGQSKLAQPTVATCVSDLSEASADDCPGGPTGGADSEMPEGQDPPARPSVASSSLKPSTESLRCFGEGTGEHSETHHLVSGLDRPCNGARLGSRLPHVEGSLKFGAGSKSVPWLIQFSLRHQDAWHLLLTLQHLAVWQLVHMCWKRYSQKPSQHTQQLQKRLPSMR